MAKTSRGHIQRLPSGSFRVKVYAGTDPVTGKARLLRQTCPDEATAAAVLGRLLVQADGGRFPDREATLGQALDKYLEVADLEVSTKEAHQGYIRRTIGPVLGEVKIRKLGADSLDIVELVMAFEEAFDLDIPDEDAEKIQTVKDAVDYIESKKKS